MKNSASLSGSLLAKKGGANPAQGFHPAGHLGGGHTNSNANKAKADPADGVEKRPVGAGDRIAMTLRLGHEQHLKLRLFAAHTRLSSQEIMKEALEHYIDENAPKSFHIACKSLGARDSH